MLWRSSAAKRRPPGFIELCSLLSASLLSACLMGFMLFATGGAALAHHSFSPFDLGNSTELEGAVLEFKFVNPHTYIVMKAKGPDGRVATWTLEGPPPTFLDRDGWTRATLKPGDQIKVTVSLLRSGGAGGMWNQNGVHFRDGKTVSAGH
jgi:hypothetical protein